jgi:hypothetical protein
MLHNGFLRSSGPTGAPQDYLGQLEIKALATERIHTATAVAVT